MKAILIAVVLLGGTASAQIVTENAGTTSPETPTARFMIRTEYAQRVLDRSLVFESRLGLIPSLEASLKIPFSSKRVEIGERNETFTGIGDAELGLKLNVHKHDQVMRSDRVAVFWGVELPTGEHHAEFDGASEPFARKLQLGTGTWDVHVGAAATIIVDRHRFSIDGVARWSSAHDGVQPGPSLRADAAYWFRLFPAVFEPGKAGMELRAVVDLSVMRQFETEGEPGDDSGTMVWLAPGLQFYATEAVLFEGNISFPVHDSTRDEFGNRHFAAFLAVKVLF